MKFSTKNWAALFAVIVSAIIVAGTASAQEPQRQTYLDGKPMFTTLPPKGVDPSRIQSDAEAGLALPNWSSSFTYQGKSYKYTMLGTDPSKGSATTHINTIMIPMKFTFSDGTVIDASQPVYGGTESSTQLTIESPMFKPYDFVDGGVDLGTTQYEDAFERANFWNYVSTVSPDYHVLYKIKKVAPVQSLTIPASFGYTGNGPKGKVGYVDNSWLDAQLQAIIYSYQSKVKGNMLLIFSMYDVFQTSGGSCCILGYHSAFGAPGLVYLTAGWADTGLFVGISDVEVISHEVGEAMDDPFIDNVVPGWKGGQVTTCSTLLEVGDPVTGVSFSVTLNGYTYHLEDLVFLPWFARETPSPSLNGWYTYLNHYTAPPAVCL